MIRFSVVGVPVTQGSAKAIIHKTTGRAVLIQENHKGLRAWRGAIRRAAETVAGGQKAPAQTPVWVTVSFRLPRPASVKRIRPSVKPDLDKLARAGLDALSGVLFDDDGQVVSLKVSKQYAIDGRPPGAVFEVMFGAEAEGQEALL